MLEPTRKEFLQAVTGLAGAAAIARYRPKVLIVVAHPDDEYAFAGTVYRITRELGGIADQVIITNGEAGYRYSALAESIYGVSLTKETDGRAHLPSIRKAEALRAGQILGVREHHFLNQRDSGFSGDAAEAGSGNWDRRKVLASLVELLDREHYDFVFTLLPTAETHGHHRAATRLALEAAAQLAERDRPAVLGAEPGQSRNPPVRYAGLAESREFRTLDPAPVLTFDRTASFGYNRALNYQIVVNWVIAEHKSQGLFQSDYGRHDVEQFWLFAGSGREALSRTQALGRNLNSTAHQVAIG